jgi:hypothetical protein
LQVFGGSQMITARMQSIKETIVADHQKALKAAISADLEASAAEEIAKAKDSNKSDSSPENPSFITSLPEIGADGLRLRKPSNLVDAD